VVLDLQAKFGNKWARIAAYLPGRTDNDVKNFWSTRQKRLAKLRRSPRPGGGRSGKNLSAKKAAASSQASEFAGVSTCNYIISHSISSLHNKNYYTFLLE
jgi:transcription factor MYB, plant